MRWQSTSSLLSIMTLTTRVDLREMLGALSSSGAFLWPDTFYRNSSGLFTFWKCCSNYEVFGTCSSWDESLDWRIQSVCSCLLIQTSIRLEVKWTSNAQSMSNTFERTLMNFFSFQNLENREYIWSLLSYQIHFPILPKKNFVCTLIIIPLNRYRNPWARTPITKLPPNVLSSSCLLPIAHQTLNIITYQLRSLYRVTIRSTLFTQHSLSLSQLEHSPKDTHLFVIRIRTIGIIRHNGVTLHLRTQHTYTVNWPSWTKTREST